MRYYELIKEDDVNPLDSAKQDIMDFIIPLKTQGINSATVNQVIDYLKSDPDLSGINIDNNFLQQVIDGINGVSLQTNSAGILCLIIDMDNQSEVPKEKKSSESKVDDMATDVSINSIKGK